MARLNIVFNPHKGVNPPQIMEKFNKETADKVLGFHKTFDGYCVTPLAELADTAKELGVGSIFVKDESYRFGLNAFKGLGGSYCLGSYLSSLYAGGELLDYSQLVSDEVKAAVGDITFVTATDGNHGRGIAWTASKLGQKSVVYMPKGSAAERLENIRKAGAMAEITNMNYDDTVRFARKQAEENGWVLVQDTTLPDYYDIPASIMQGYLTMAAEAVNQLGSTKPTHLFLQAGVGSMAGAIAAYMHSVYGKELKIIIVEPDKADCVYRTAKVDNGTLQIVTGDMDTIMAGLACGEVCETGWHTMKYCADAFVSMEDCVAATAMRILASPAGKDNKVVSGESGAAGFGAAVEILKNHPEIKEKLGMNEDSVVLCFSTEGATDVKNYRNIVWNGAYPHK